MTIMNRGVDGLYITNAKQFKSLGHFSDRIIYPAFDFAFGMTFGGEGEHRMHRSGGTHHRRLGEIFADAFQGKLAEYAFYYAIEGKIKLEYPQLDKWKLGKWDETDFVVSNKKVNIKSTKSFGNLLLLETKDWNKNGEYIPNINKGTSLYDFFILIRMKPYCADILKGLRLLYSDTADYYKLKNVIMENKWEFDIPGWISLDDLKTAINDNQIIKRGEMLNGKTKMDADNYYIQSGDLKPLEQLIELLK